MTSEKPVEELPFLEVMKQQFKEIAAMPGYKPSQEVREVVDHLFLLGFRESEVVDIIMILKYTACNGEELDTRLKARAFVQRIKPNLTVGRHEERTEWVYLNDGVGPPDTPYVKDLLQRMENIEIRQKEAENLTLELYTSGKGNYKVLAKVLNEAFPDLVETHRIKASQRRVERFLEGWPSERFFWSLRDQ